MSHLEARSVNLKNWQKKNFNSISWLSNSFTKGPVKSHPTIQPMGREVTDVGRDVTVDVSQHFCVL